MTIIYATINTLDFIKKLEAVGIEPKVAETHIEVQSEMLKAQAKVYEQALENELKNFKQELATKNDLLNVRNEIKLDIQVLKTDVELLKKDFNSIRNELIIKLGGIVVGSITILGVIMASIITHAH